MYNPDDPNKHPSEEEQLTPEQEKAKKKKKILLIVLLVVGLVIGIPLLLFGACIILLKGSM